MKPSSTNSACSSHTPAFWVFRSTERAKFSIKNKTNKQKTVQHSKRKGHDIHLFVGLHYSYRSRSFISLVVVRCSLANIPVPLGFFGGFYGSRPEYLHISWDVFAVKNGMTRCSSGCSWPDGVIVHLHIPSSNPGLSSILVCCSRSSALLSSASI